MTNKEGNGKGWKPTDMWKLHMTDGIGYIEKNPKLKTVLEQGPLFNRKFI